MNKSNIPVKNSELSDGAIKMLDNIYIIIYYKKQLKDKFLYVISLEA